MMNYLGIDIGGTAIKYGAVNFGDAITTSNFDMMLIPQTQRTEKYTSAVLGLLKSASKYKAVGIGFPSVVWEDGILDLEIKFTEIWKAASALLQETKIPVYAINDADAAGFAELYNPEASDLRKGVTVVLTLGTGIGSAIFLDGKLIPNTEFGMIELHEVPAEQYAAASIKRRDGLAMQEWASRLQEYLEQVEILLSPDNIVLGGGISANFDEFRPYLTTKRAVLAPAFYRNQAGVIGAAMYSAFRCKDCLLEEKFGLHLNS